MPAWNLKPSAGLLADVSLWSADLANLERAVKQMSPYADSFHFDVADAHFVPGFLFFPDLIAALRPHTERPFHVHLMVDEPSKVVEQFVSAGANLVTVHCELGEPAVREAVSQVRALGSAAGVAVRLDTSISAVEPFVDSVSAIVLLGTDPGVKGKELSPKACIRVQEFGGLLERRGLRSRVVIIADGGIRKHTVSRLREAGADVIVPGSLVFQADDLHGTFAWIHSLGAKK